MATQQTIKVSVGYMNQVPAVGHLEFIIHYTRPQVDLPRPQVDLPRPQAELPADLPRPQADMPAELPRPQAELPAELPPSQDAILTLISPHVLAYLGGNVDEWIINSYDFNEEEYIYSGVTYLYNFEWKNINNRDRSCPIMRTVSFRIHRHQFELVI